MGVENLTRIWPTVLVRKVKGKTHNFEANLCGSLYSTFPTMHVITNGYERFSKTNSSDPRQRVPLTRLYPQNNSIASS